MCVRVCVCASMLDTVFSSCTATNACGSRHCLARLSAHNHTVRAIQYAPSSTHHPVRAVPATRGSGGADDNGIDDACAIVVPCIFTSIGVHAADAVFESGPHASYDELLAPEDISAAVSVRRSCF